MRRAVYKITDDNVSIFFTLSARRRRRPRGEYSIEEHEADMQGCTDPWMSDPACVGTPRESGSENRAAIPRG